MKRELYVSTPSVQQLSITAPVDKGGTGGTTSAEVAVSLGGILTATIGQAGGPVKQEVGGGVAKTALPSAVPLGATMDGPQDFYVGSSNTLSITNYDANTSYAVSASAGTISINGSNVTFVAPATPQAVTLTIGGRQVVANVIALAPVRPKITVPTYGSTNQALTGLQITGNAFQIPSGTPSHQQSDWQLATDPNFNNIVQQSLNDTVNKTTWTVNGLTALTIYYVRVRYKDTNLGYSNWSNAGKFTTSTFSGVNTEEAKIVSTTPVAGAQGGLSIKLTADGTRAIYGAWRDTAGATTNVGAGYVFVRSGTTWTMEQKLTPSDGVSGDQFGRYCDISADGTRIVMSSPNATVASTSTAGAAYVFVRSGSVWTQEQKLQGSPVVASARFGQSVSFNADGSRLAVGASADTATGTASAGAVYVFLRTGTSWAQEQKVVASDKTANWNYGGCVKLSADGTRMAVGSTNATTTVTSGAGAVYTYTRSGTTWTLEQKFFASDGTSGAAFGSYLTCNSDFSRIVVSAYSTTNGTVYSFTRSGSVWTQEQIIVPTDPASGNGFGTGVALTDDGSILYIGSWGSINGSLTLSGAAYVFTRTGSVWTQKTKLTQSDPLQGARFGSDIACSSDGSRIAVGAANASVGATTTAGAGYIFR